MDRRKFFSRMLVGGLATAALPSQIWPFRKIFLPTYTVYPDMDFNFFGLHFWMSEWLLDPVSGVFRRPKLVSTGIDSFGNETYFVTPDPDWPKEIHPRGNYQTIKRGPAMLEGLNEYDVERWKLTPQPTPGTEGYRSSVVIWPQAKRNLKTLQEDLS